MENIVWETSPNPIVEISNIGGDLRLTGWDQSQFVVEADDEDSVIFDHDGDRLKLQANTDCTIRLPQGAQVSVRTVGGDAKILKLSEQILAIGNVGGDLTLRQIASANIGVVGGDLKIKHVQGDLQVGHVGGDLEAREVEGAFKSGNVGGDLYLVEVGGAIQAITGGDVTLSVDFKPEQDYSLQSGGDFTCRVGPEASVRLALTAGGDINLDVPVAQVVGSANRKTVTLGAGAAAANLRAGGDLNLSGLAFDAEAMGDFDEKFGEDFANMADQFAAQIGSQIESQIEAQMADFEKQMAERMAGLTLGANPIDAAKIAATARQAAERVQRAGRQQAEAARRQAEKEAERAQRIAEAAQRRAEAINRKVREEHGRRGWPFRAEPPRQPSPPRPPMPPRATTPARPFGPAASVDPVSDEERMLILRMVEQGKISVADAEKLLAALENK
jgi:hypothetical protein